MIVSGVKLLAIDDDQTLLQLFRDSFALPKYDLFLASDGSEAISTMGEISPDVVILDLNMPKMKGIEVLREIRAKDDEVEVIVLTGHGTIGDAVEAMRLGAYDFLTKPMTISHLQAIIEKAMEKRNLRRENVLLRRQIESKYAEEEIVWKSPLMGAVLDQVQRYAASDFPVLILGETGVGKELVARAIHSFSPRATEPFVPLNCGAIPDTMLESELLGHEKGAFTGAQVRKQGLLEVASGGTLFRDEIGEMSLSLQGKLLRSLETGRFFRLGGTVEVSVQVRLLAATNRDIEGEVREKKFRADLFYRISTLPITVPPLRQRREDIPLLVRHMTASLPAFRGKVIDDGALEVLADYDWPGNVRELKNVVYRLLLLSQGDRVTADDVSFDPLPRRRETGEKRLEEVEREHILAVLSELGGHRGKAAEALGISQKTLYRKLLAYGYKD
jgi:DNA-binding NtrC family response regulator